MPAGAAEIAAWRPGVAGIVEVLHARFVDHAYPLHTHRSWTLLIVDDGFGRRFGLPPHRYVTGRRIDAARRLLLDGRPAAEMAAVTGFADQAHLSRLFVRHLGTTPGRFAGATTTRSRRRRSRSARGAAPQPVSVRWRDALATQVEP